MTTRFSSKDEQYMKLAISMANRGLGRVAPNPNVGCVLVKEGEVLSKACTADGGRPHAEIQAIDLAGVRAKGATAYVTLEPCSHYGETPPCVKKLIEAGVTTVYIAVQDPDPRVNGKGIQMLKDHGLSVHVGLLEKEAVKSMAGFICAQTLKRPFVTIKTASTLDGKIATARGESQWITSSESRLYVHKERSEHDAVLVGIETVLADNPRLTTRFPGIEHNPIKVILDSKGRMPKESILFAKGTIIFTLFDTFEISETDGGPEIIHVDRDYMGRCDLEMCLSILAEKGVTRLFVEGGPTIHTAFLKSGLFDRLLWFRAPTLIGKDGISAVQSFDIKTLAQRFDLKREKIRKIGQDLLEIYEKED